MDLFSFWDILTSFTVIFVLYIYIYIYIYI
jgi:hypothetical protein